MSLDFIQKLASIKIDVDKHFNSKKKNWPKFIQKMKSKKFRDTILSNPNSDEKLKAFVSNIHNHNTGKIIAQVPSSNNMKTYDVKIKDGKYSCDCDNYKYVQAAVGGQCKHIKGLDKLSIKTALFSQDTKDRANSFLTTIGTGMGLIRGSSHLMDKLDHKDLMNEVKKYPYKPGDLRASSYLHNRVSDLSKKMNVPMPDKVEIGGAAYKPKFNWIPDKLKTLGGSSETIEDLKTSVLRASPIDSESTILHELGHHKNWINKSDKAKALYGLSRTVTGIKPMLALSAYTSLKEDPESNAGKYFLAASAPKLIDEGVATGRAFNTLRKMHGWKKGLRSGAQLLPAFGTYAAAATMPLLGTYLNKKFRSNTSTQEKTASAYVTPMQQETQKTCSAACLRMVLDYYGTKKEEKELVETIGVHKSGAEVTEITKAAKKLGFEAFDKEFSLEEAQKCLDAGIPIIMDGKSYNFPGKYHYTVLCDMKDGKAFIADPNCKGNKRTITVKELEDRWTSKEMYSPHRDKKHWGVLIIPS